MGIHEIPAESTPTGPSTSTKKGRNFCKKGGDSTRMDRELRKLESSVNYVGRKVFKEVGEPIGFK